MEQYFIDTLHSELNVIRDVFNPSVTNETLSQKKSKLIKAKYLFTFIIKKVISYSSALNLKAQAQLATGINSSLKSYWNR